MYRDQGGFAPEGPLDKLRTKRLDRQKRGGEDGKCEALYIWSFSGGAPQAREEEKTEGCSARCAARGAAAKRCSENCKGEIPRQAEAHPVVCRTTHSVS